VSLLSDCIHFDNSLGLYLDLVEIDMSHGLMWEFIVV